MSKRPVRNRPARTPQLFEPVERRVLMASISGVEFSDLNSNGLRDAGEPPLAGWTVYVDLNHDHAHQAAEASAISDASGAFTIANLAAGNYSVSQVVPTGWQQTSPNPGGSPGIAAMALAQTAQNSRGSALNDTIRSAIAQLGNLNSYSATQIRGTHAWVVGTLSGASIQSIITNVDATAVRKSVLLDDTYVLNFSAARSGGAIASRLGSEAGVNFFYPLIASQHGLKLVPNDPLFAQQWHLQNSGQSGGSAGADIDVAPAWDTAQGDGVVIGVVDDGLQYTHPDLAPNYSSALSHDFFAGDSDPAPGPGNNHGTSTAGIAAGRGNNSVGVSGVAPHATLAGLRLPAGATTDQQDADALSYLGNDIAIYSNSWGPADEGGHIEAPGPLALAALQNGVTSGRGGKGNIYVWAGGNGRQNLDNVNYDGYANSRYTIAVSAVDRNGKAAYYSEPGAPILVTAPGGDGFAGITTTDLTGSPGYSAGDYNSTFSGTSASTPVVSGVVALMLQANPNLTWRDVEAILAHSAQKNDASSAGWTTNGAGLHINYDYGFGEVDAAAAVSLAQGWTNLGAEQTLTSGTISVGQSIPDADASGLSSSFNINSNIRVETVEVVLNATHAHRGQLRVVLTSPDGTQSVLADVHFDSNADYPSWTFTTKRNWDELSKGTWTLNVTDGTGGTVGTWNSWKLNIYGSAVDPSARYAVVNANDTATSVDFGNHDIAAPSVVSMIFNVDAARQNITAQFSEDVSGSLATADLTLVNLTTNTTIPSSDLSLSYNPATNIASLTYTANAAGVLPDGNYRATIVASGVSDASSNALPADQSVDFFVLAGDANHDRSVDVSDLGILATYWQESPRAFSQGDFNYDGQVDVSDLGILATNWQNTLPAPAAPIPFFASTTPPTVQKYDTTTSTAASPLLEILA